MIYALADGRGVIGEYAGAFRAAHSGGENDDAVGVQFHLGCTEVDADGQPVSFQAMPDAMVTAYRVLRDEVLHKFAITNLNTLEVTHQDMPDAATACPGASVIDRLPGTAHRAEDRQRRTRDISGNVRWAAHRCAGRSGCRGQAGAGVAARRRSRTRRSRRQVPETILQSDRPGDPRVPVRQWPRQRPA